MPIFKPRFKILVTRTISYLLRLSKWMPRQVFRTLKDGITRLKKVGYGRTMRTIPLFIRRKVRAGHFMTVEPPALGGIMTWEAASGLNGSR